ncbi:MAG: hypothetical protein MRY64_01010 [Hyphomonadaceae bacterium]|nr:hypothetical protein [Hyphomonadaceae bacterium]
MKVAALLAAALIASSLGACVSTAAHDRDQAYTACRSLEDTAAREQCMSDEIAMAVAERDARTAAYEAELAEDEHREALLEAYGVPEDERAQSQKWPLPD